MTTPAVRSAEPSHALQLYVQVVVATGTLVLARAGVEAARTPHPLAWLTLAALALLSGWFRLNFKSVSATIGIDDTFCITSALLFGPGPATLAIVSHSVVYSVRRRRPARQMAFNAAALALAMWGSASTFFVLSGVGPLALVDAPITQLVGPLLAMAAVYFALNSGLTAVAVGLDSGQSPIRVWKQNFRWLWVGYLGAGSVAFCLILLVQQRSFTAAAMVLPLLAIFHLTLRATFGRLEDAHRHLGDMDRLYLSTVETLAMAIDAKDDVTHSHVRRVQAYAIGLARALSVTDEPTLKAIEAAALLHDTGKLAVPEHILNKPGKLTAAEFERMKLHVDVGADILSLVEFPYPVVPIVRAHHESWDGSGYPRGLSGDDIPIGARILSVVDCFDALTSDRPYRRRMTDAAAIEILLERRGRMYDPTVVDTFIKVYRDINVAGADMTEHREVLQRITQSHQEAPPSPERHETMPEGSAAPTSLLAFVSLSRVAAGDAGVADVLALGSRLIGDVVPGATGAWFLPEPNSDRIVAAEAFGPSAHAVRGAAMVIGDRLTGWVAANRQPIVSSPANLDLGPRVETAEPALRTCMSVPLLKGDSLVAVLSLYSPETDAFDEAKSRLIQMVAPHLAVAIHAAATAAAGAASSAEPRSGGEKAAAASLRLVATR
jgi:putative nucleotidyltransferase with HDIG domain